MLNTGQSLSHFKIIKRLGAGGMGEVYLAEDTKLGRKVALKILLSDYFEDAERKERFYREAKTAAGVSHPNVMAIHDISSAPDPDSGHNLDFIVMEYIEGRPLTGYIQEAHTDMRTMIRLAEHIAAGLTAAHKVNIVHRDIKADNIIIDNDGNSKILDFGLAKPVAPLQSKNTDVDTDTVSQELTQAGKIIGTVSYMSPEQIRGEAIDSRSDIFSFGILLYRMITGQLPFESDTQVSTLAKILESHPEPPHTKNDQIPAELERIIDKCLQKDANDRYQDTRDLVVDLRNLRRQFDSNVSGVTTGITDASKIMAARGKGGQMWKKLVPAFLAVIILAAVFLAIFNDSDSGSSNALQAGENGLAILGFENKTGEDSLTWLQTGLPEILLTDLAQSQSLNIISRDRVLDCVKSDGKTEITEISHPDCLDAANSLGAKHALSGSYYRMGENIRIDARLEEIATGRIILTEKVVGTDPFVLVDSLTTKIAQSLNLDDSITTRTSVKTFTSSSPEAYKIYLAALEQFDIELFDEAIEGFTRAIELDSTFALSYMRIGMAHVFDGRPQEGARWFEKARMYQDRLPTWEASLLDVYADTWLDQNYDDAFIKMELLIRNYPNDKESRYIYGLMVLVFTQDTVATQAQMDTALQLDPRYFPVLSWNSGFLRNQGKFEEAKEYILKIRQFYPESPDPYIMLAGIYMRQNDFEKAAAEYKALLDIHPDESRAIFGLVSTNVNLRKFDEADKYLELITEYYADDPYTMSDYYDNKANIALWQGKFKTAMDYRFDGLEQIMITGDSTLVAARYAVIASFYTRYDMTDSIIYYSRLNYEWGTAMNAVDYPIALVTYDKSQIDTARVIFENGVDFLKSRFPSNMWTLIDAIQKMFEANVIDDTAKIIEAYMDISKSSASGGDANKRVAGILYILTGEYQIGKDLITPFVAGERMISSGLRYPYLHYLLGVAEEGLGNTQQAIIHYEEMLKFWGSPEIELKEIKDARSRLAKLVS